MGVSVGVSVGAAARVDVGRTVLVVAGVGVETGVDVGV
jgi:hypothetical protein